MRRRDVIASLGAAAAWPLAARAQPGEPMRRVGVLMPLPEGDPESQRRIVAFRQGLHELGWTPGRNLQIEARWAAGDAERTRVFANELAALAPDVILASGSAAAGPMLQATRSLPVVFVIVPDPVGAGFVDSLARPGGNATGFLMFEYGIAGKWLELLKQVAPDTTRVAVIRDPAITAGIGQWAATQTAAPALGMEAIPVNVRDAGEIERAIAGFAQSPNGAVIVTGSALAVVHRDRTIAQIARHRLPAIYFQRSFVDRGGLISYGPDLIDQYRQAARYVDRILKGEKPADLPVQAPTRFELVINLKTARSMGLEVPATVLARADAVIE
jgi:putative ABC transport system substrate-binding protein